MAKTVLCMNPVTTIIESTIVITMITLQHSDNFREIRANITWYREKLVVKFD